LHGKHDREDLPWRIAIFGGLSRQSVRRGHYRGYNFQILEARIVKLYELEKKLISSIGQVIYKFKLLTD